MNWAQIELYFHTSTKEYFMKSINAISSAQFLGSLDLKCIFSSFIILTVEVSPKEAGHKCHSAAALLSSFLVFCLFKAVLSGTYISRFPFV